MGVELWDSVDFTPTLALPLAGGGNEVSNYVANIINIHERN
jgi:hypothetical protein